MTHYRTCALSLAFLHLSEKYCRTDTLKQIIEKTSNFKGKVNFTWMPSHIKLGELDNIDCLAKQSVLIGDGLSCNLGAMDTKSILLRVRDLECVTSF